MSLEDGVFSLILEANLNSLGFIRIHNTIVCNAGNMFVRPIGLNTVANMEDNLWGYQVGTPTDMMKDFTSRQLHLLFYSTAKIAIDRAMAMD